MTARAPQRRDRCAASHAARVLVALWLASLPAAAAPAAGEGSFAAIAAAVQGEIDAGRIPGAVVLVGRGDDVLYRAAVGARALQPQVEPISTDTVFDLASLTKVVATTTAVMQLAEAGRIELDVPAVRYWPEFAGHGKRAITVRELLAHRSGLAAGFGPGPRWDGYAGAMRRLAREPASRPAQPRYGDLNFIALGEIVRRVSGLPLDRYCERHIFGPLGMRDTGFHPAPARSAPTEFASGAWLRGVVHDPIARRMAAPAGHAGLFSTAEDLSIFARMLLGGGALDGVRILRSETVDRMLAPQGESGAGWRALGWDRDTPYWTVSTEAFGHSGYTGTSIWIDPASRSYVVILSSRVHPDGRGDARGLRRAVAATVLEALALRQQRVETGIDVLAREGYAALRGRRVGLVTNDSGRDHAGRRTADLLRAAPGVKLVALFSPEHGLDSRAEGPVASGRDAGTQVPVHSLYGDTRRLRPEWLAGIDALVYDIQDAGVRFYTYIATLGYTMQAAAAARIPIYVLDRPNPIDAGVVQGPMLDTGLESFTAWHRLPVRYGMTAGELARLFNAQRGIGADLRVIAMTGYGRGQWFDDTGQAWVAPSPNLRTVVQAALYPGVAMVEGANVSVGRGTDSPFELVGAPWIDADALARHLNERRIAGAEFAPVSFEPRADAYAGQPCHGVRVRLVDRRALDSPALGIEIAAALHAGWPERFKLRGTLGMIGAQWVLDAIAAGEDPRAIARRWQPYLERFIALREPYLLYGQTPRSPSLQTGPRPGAGRLPP
ncbi:MAG: exo-beta-N-acetylmuramidase NamZ domain-containing protein [Gammaproteobacteria bacterium]